MRIESPTGDLFAAEEAGTRINLRVSMSGSELRTLITSTAAPNLTLLESEKMAIYQAVMSTLTNQTAFDIEVEYLEIRNVEGTIEARKGTLNARTAWPVVRNTILTENSLIEEQMGAALASEISEGTTIRDESGELAEALVLYF